MTDATSIVGVFELSKLRSHAIAKKAAGKSRGLFYRDGDFYY